MPVGGEAGYEYACMTTYKSGCGCACGGASDYRPDQLKWGSQNSAERAMFDAVQGEVGRQIREKTEYSFEFRVVKRRKAGRMEEL